MMRNFQALLLFCLLAVNGSVAQESRNLPGDEFSEMKIKPNSTFCNPLNLNYRFQKMSKLVREAADPVLLVYKNDYYLFASKSGGYWWSKDMTDWTLVEATELPLEAYAPAVFEYGGELYFMASSAKKLYKSRNPKDPASWNYVGPIRGDTDPALFLDEDGRVYLYFGCKLLGWISGVELDPKNNFAEIGSPVKCVLPDFLNRGWEVAGDTNQGGQHKGRRVLEPWIEGSWMTKHNGKYYLQYAAPGTQYTSYADGVFVSDSPLGPFTYCDYSPVSFCPTGFSPGAGHGCTFADKAGQTWKILTGVISVRHMFERRLNLFPAGFDKDGEMFTSTYLADLPQFLPGFKSNPATDNLVGWMLLSYKKEAQCSSAKSEYPVGLAFDENIKTYWSSESGDRGEWLQVDLGKVCSVNAIQVNFAEESTDGSSETRNDPHQYLVEISEDGKAWRSLVDKSNNEKDCPHDYVQLDRAEHGRYLKLTNVHMPFNGKFAVRELRVFGNAGGSKPAAVTGLKAVRNETDGRSITLSWDPAKDRNGVVVRYGIYPNKLYHSYLIRGDSPFSINSLNRNVTYYFSADALNESGITAGADILRQPPTK